MIIVVVLVVLMAFWAVITSNGFVRREIMIVTSLSDIEGILTKRHDALVKLLDVAKEYAKRERRTLTDLVQLRKGMSIRELNEASVKMDEMMSRIMGIEESNTKLKSDETLEELQREIADAGERLQEAVRLYNESVKDYNKAISGIPARFVASGRTPYAFFEA